MDVIAYFALQLGNGDLSKEIALPFDYRIYLYQGGSLLEGIFAVLTNCMIITDTNEVLNRHHAIPVSYTHLDVYKRQAHGPGRAGEWGWGEFSF